MDGIEEQVWKKLEEKCLSIFLDTYSVQVLRKQITYFLKENFGEIRIMYKRYSSTDNNHSIEI